MTGTEPLYEKIRPQKIEDILGNEKLKEILKTWVNNKRIRSFVIWGEPGSGKSTIIRALLNDIKDLYEIYSISGALEGKKKIKSIIEKENNLFSKSKLLFVDEIHRLNKAEQDTLLLSVETGELTLIGATTENPAISINPALLSRILVFKTNELAEKDYEILFDNIEKYYGDLRIEKEARKALVEYAGKDIRRIMNLIETTKEAGNNQITLELLKDFTGYRLNYDIKSKYGFISAYIKSVRGSDPDAAILYLAYMLESGEDPMYIARRMVILSSEDIGLADPNAINIAVSAMVATEHIGYPECYLPLSEATLYLCACPKSNSSYLAYAQAKEFISQNNFEIPAKLINPLNKTMQKQGFGLNYKYPHDYGGFVKESYMPEGFEKLQFFTPKDIGVEKRIKERLKELWKDQKKY
ncbi:replication-associated recombination protein A [Petrotoga sp. 9PWA.NaAc.5.4]|uniref:replication-associated recombination protein A n=1 Tax=Petrotoga sp. 9PWA.NaAc.5.4 TaxID=1434328 RepID=UPI000CC97295|nr:replication-associated recombination protein A [Petrotoga sp. 9PWA.NaAc.5.4]PNR95760.1 recombinase RarA [Petrotoga sp. 9PWA.NaAc.5.4]